MKKVELTKEGYQKIVSELDELKKTKRPYAVDRLQKARAMGDLSENSEYVAAKEELAFIEGRIQEIEEILKNVVVAENHNHSQTVALGNYVTVGIDGKEDIFQIVGEYEANPMQKKLSLTSPIGAALLNKKVGDDVWADTPAGKIKYKVVDIK